MSDTDIISIAGMALLSAAILIVLLYLGLPWLYGRLLRMRLTRKVTDTGSVALTFDDGPGDRLTPAILHLLDELNVKATFFLLGKNIFSREHLVKTLAQKGHDIGCHGYDHLHGWKVGPFRMVKDIKKGWQTLDTALGRKDGIYFYRPPSGKLNLSSLVYLLSHRVPVIYWTHDLGDTSPRDLRDSSLAADQIRSSDGAVLLMHDFDRRDPNKEKFILESIKNAVLTARQIGLPLVTISELLANTEK